MRGSGQGRVMPHDASAPHMTASNSAPSFWQRHTFLRRVVRVVMGCATSKEDAATHPGSTSIGGDSQGDTVRTSFMSSDPSDSPEVLKEVGAMHTPGHPPLTGTPSFHQAPAFRPCRTSPLPPFLPTHARPSLAPTRRAVGRVEGGDGKPRLHVRGCQGAECGRRATAQKIFASVGQKHQYRAGDTLIEQGKPSDQCYYILKVRL